MLRTDVENNGDAGPVELVTQVGLAALRKETGGQSLEIDREAIAVELFSIQ